MAASVSAVLANSFGARLLRPQRSRNQGDPQPVKQPREAPATAAVTFSVQTIHCAACVNNIRLYLTTESGIERVDGDAKAKTVSVHYVPDDIDAKKIEALIARLGYAVSETQAEN